MGDGGGVKMASMPEVSSVLSILIPFSDDYRATKFAMKSFYYIRLFKANEIHKITLNNQPLHYY